MVNNKKVYLNDICLQYIYDALSRHTTLRDPDNNITTYNYNSTTLRLSNLQHPYSGTTSYTYNNYGELIRIDYANGTLASYGYDDLGRIRSVGNSGYGDNIFAFTYTYNNDSNVTWVDIMRGPGAGPQFYKTYAYDALHRLSSEYKKNSANTTLYSYAYQYDAVGNRTQMDNFTGAQTIATTYSYNNLNQLTLRVVNAGPDQGTWTYGYDANGNMIWEQKGQTPIREFNYNFDDRMVTVSNPKRCICKWK